MSRGALTFTRSYFFRCRYLSSPSSFVCVPKSLVFSRQHRGGKKRESLSLLRASSHHRTWIHHHHRRRHQIFAAGAASMVMSSSSSDKNDDGAKKRGKERKMTTTTTMPSKNTETAKNGKKRRAHRGQREGERGEQKRTLTTERRNNVKHESEPPKNWEKTLATIKRMRKNGPLAPVDTMGCEKIAETDDKKQKRYRTLISAMLSSQTKDQINHATMNKLIALNKDTAEGILNTTEDDLDEIIHQVGFHRNKAKYLRAAAKICIEKYGGDIPPDLESLVELPGVGPKMGHLIMNVGWEKPSGICVDVHVHRITERLGWVSESCAVTNAGSPRKRTPEDTRVALEKWLPKDEWVEINPLLVGFGQLYCTPLRPKCSECDVVNLCENAFRDAAPKKSEA